VILNHFADYTDMCVLSYIGFDYKNSMWSWITDNLGPGPQLFHNIIKLGKLGLIASNAIVDISCTKDVDEWVHTTNRDTPSPLP